VFVHYDYVIHIVSSFPPNKAAVLPDQGITCVKSLGFFSVRLHGVVREDKKNFVLMGSCLPLVAPC